MVNSKKNNDIELIEEILRLKNLLKKNNINDENSLKINFFEDIDEIKANEEKYRTLFESANDSIFLMNDNTFIDCNTKTIKLFECKKEDIIGKRPSEFSPQFQPSGRYSDDLAKEKIGKAMAGEPQFFEWKHCTLDGKLFDAEVSLTKFEVKNNPCILAIVRDITDRKQAEKEIKKSEERYRQLTENLNDIVSKFNPKGEIIYISPICKKIIGYEPKELIGKSLKTIVHPDEIELLFKFQTSNFLKEHNSSIVKHRLKKKDGSYIWVESNNQLIYDSNSVLPTKIVCVTRDISELVKNDELLKEIEEVELANKTKSAFLANMSHEIRNPMNAIIGICNTLSRSELSAENMKYVNSIRVSSTNLLNILNGLLDLSKIEARKMELTSVNFNISELMADVYNLFENQTNEKNITFNYNIDKEIPKYLYGDDQKIRQIFINLISNAIKFSENGSIKISIDLLKKENNIATITFKVIDTGIGIKKEYLDKIFQSFTQVDSSTTKKFAGTGLGLAIVKNLSEILNGKISVESKYEKGSTFIFEVPLEISTEKNYQANLPISEPFINTNYSKKIKVLLAEDDAINQMYLKSFLETQGWEVVSAHNGVEAIDRFKDGNFDIILMDGQMPIMDGFTATKQIRELEISKKTHIPIIAITGYAVTGDKEKFLDSGMDGYISKPIDEYQLIDMIKEFTS